MSITRTEAAALMDVGVLGYVGLLDSETKRIIEQPHMHVMTVRDGGDRFARIFLTDAGRDALREWGG